HRKRKVQVPGSHQQDRRRNQISPRIPAALTRGGIFSLNTFTNGAFYAIIKPSPEKGARP
ncbi:MAG: hypothetical protein IJF67_15020, partial [Clostridia bacterium]|nr:hypothetical protein [Clostridia bacterium]